MSMKLQSQLKTNLIEVCYVVQTLRIYHQSKGYEQSGPLPYYLDGTIAASILPQSLHHNFHGSI
jgi:hypothetical protein